MALAGIEYSGIAGASSSCKDAIVCLLHFGDEIHKADLLHVLVSTVLRTAFCCM